MTRLAGFVIMNQLADTGEKNAGFDCVPTSIAMCLEYLLRQSFDGAAIKDAVYGKDYTGGTAAEKYVDYCKQHGATLFPLNGEPAQLVQDIKAQIGKGLPCIATEPDPYANPSLGWSHVVAFHAFDEPAGTLTAADPYGGHDVTLPDAQWQGRLLDKQIWSVERIQPTLVLPANWSDDGKTLSTPTGKAVLGFRQEILNLLHAGKWDADDFIIGEQFYAEKLELSNTALGPGDQLITNKHLLAYPHDPQGSVAHLKNTVVIEYVGKELDACRRKLLEYQARLNQPQPIALPQDEAAITQFLAQVGPLHGWKQG